MILRIQPELVAWTAGLVLLACMDPHADLPSLCVWRWIGFGECPGCGLGHSISHIFHAQWQESWNAHKLGAPVLAALLWRIGQLTKSQIHSFRHG
ncbi:DUF2752 domain-containing protein [Chitinophaga rhizosphaerae]|uniref:DUF2752 domain-containing protein n=1 Tax=Chitinophaga rhizosphaerae TaxID=1864947 RepID=UPI000F80D10D|nr:DUF2752 domain-containing protein [Chitinophaga rhizosphaerae]